MSPAALASLDCVEDGLAQVRMRVEAKLLVVLARFLSKACPNRLGQIHSSPHSSVRRGYKRRRGDAVAGVLQRVPDVGKPCPDENFCNGVETCNASGVCTAGTPVDCSQTPFGAVDAQCGRSFCSEQEQKCKVQRCPPITANCDLLELLLQRSWRSRCRSQGVRSYRPP